MNTIKSFLQAHPTLQRYLLSSLNTFVATFLSTLGTLLATGNSGVAINMSLILGLVGTAIRVAVKAVGESVVGQHNDPQT